MIIRHVLKEQPRSQGSQVAKRVKKKLGTIYDHKVSRDRLEAQHESQ